MLILLFINHFNGMLFYVDLEGIYHRDPLFLVQYLLSYVYVFTASIHAMRGIRKAQNGSRRRLMVNLAIFPLAPAAAGILQFLYPEIPLACVALSFETLILYHTWLEEMISIDPLTHLNNRKQLSHTFDQWTQHEEQTPLFLLLIDANKFKRINDTYGHIQFRAMLRLNASRKLYASPARICIAVPISRVTAVMNLSFSSGKTSLIRSKN